LFLIGTSGTASAITETTFGLGKSFSAIEEWARRENFQPELLLTYHLLGLDYHTVAIANLATEIVKEESQQIVAEWAGSQIAQRLSEFSHAFIASDKYTTHTEITISGSNAKIAQVLGDKKERSFLLFLLLTSSPNFTHCRYPQEAVINHQRLKVWLILQAAERLAGKAQARDAFVSTVARFLSKPRDDGGWSAICALLDQLHQSTRGFRVTYQQFSDAVGIAATPGNLDAEARRRASGFFNALGKLADGEYDPIRSHQTSRIAGLDQIASLASSKEAEVEIPPPLFNVDGQGFTSLDLDDTEHEGSNTDSEPAFVLDVDPTDTAAEQAISVKTFHLLSQEEANYLPWSLTGVLPPERAALERWIEAGLESETAERSLGAAIVGLSAMCSRSFYFTLAFQVSESVGFEWSLNEDLTVVHRLAPRRSSSWEPSAKQVNLIIPFQKILAIEIAPGISRALRAVREKAEGSPKTLHALWKSVSDEKMETWFHRERSDEISRVLTTMPGKWAAQAAYDRSGDHNLTRLLMAEPNSGLPAACAYGYWSAGDVEKAIAIPALSSGPLTNQINVMGSRLVMEGVYLDSWINQVKSMLTEAPTLEFIAFHNRIATFCVVALYAATGCRHTQDPFESLSYIDLERRNVYIDDKSDGVLHNGRLTPLPDGVCLLVAEFITYLKWLAEQLRASAPDFTKELVRLAEGRPANLPLFFLLDAELNWHSLSVTNSQLPGLPIAEWELRANQFRHRYEQVMPRAGVHPEVVDAWMGHSERGVATYSDSSPRCWLDDVDMYRDEINKVYNELNLPTRLPLPPLPSVAVENPLSRLRAQKFGIKLRKEQRAKNLKRAVSEAHRDINLFLRNRKIAGLDKADIEQLAKKMLFNDLSVPAPYAAIRLEILNRKVRKEGDPSKPVIAKIIAGMQPEKSYISEGVIPALKKIPELDKWAGEALRVSSQNRMSKIGSASLGAVVLSIVKRISYRQLVQDVASGRHYRVVQHGARYFVEYNETLELDDFNAPVQRHEVNYKLASLLQKGIGHNGKEKILEDSPHDAVKTLPIGNLMGANVPTRDLKALTGSLCATIGQYNLIAMPSAVAGALSDRHPPSSAPIQDVLRIVEGRYVKLPKVKSEQDEVFTAETPEIEGNAADLDKLQLQNNANSYLQEIYNELKKYEPNLRSAKATVIAITAISQKRQNDVSNAVLQLGYWIGEKIRSGKGRGNNFSPYAIDTITTYFSTLRGPFAGVLYDTDLTALESEELTDCYEELLEVAKGNKKYLKYFGDLLQSFHGWAAQYGLEEPDWSELDLGVSSRHVSAGLVSEADYLAVLRHLHGSSNWQQVDHLFLGFVLLLSFRFGLRSKEARFLRRRDWCEYGGQIWVLVENNRKRRLKSRMSRRAVPLLFQLENVEIKLIEMMLAHYNATAGEEKNDYLLCEAIDGKPQLTSKHSNIPKALIKLLRQATGSSHLVLHHCRHTFYNAIFAVLCPAESLLHSRLSKSLNVPQIRANILGPQSDLTRRIGMAVPRLMGHSGPSSGLKNYNHLMTVWCDSLTPMVSERCLDVNGAFNTGDLEESKPMIAMVDQNPLAYPAPTLERVLKTLRLVSQGRSYAKAGQLAGLKPVVLANLESVVGRTNNKMRFKRRLGDWSAGNDRDEKDWFMGAELPTALLQYIQESAWSRLIDFAKGSNFTIDSEHTKWCEVEKISEFVGERRHLLFVTSEGCAFVKYVLKLLKLTSDDYVAVAKGNNPDIADILRVHGFVVDSELESVGAGGKIRLDPFPDLYRGGVYLKKYGGVVVGRRKEGFIRNSHELAVAFLAIAVLVSSQDGDR
jgi:integrase